ncbi:MAG: MGMT family protein [Candidatus Izimaplasma sp.]|nr:MGMT family protein [Candidatus Izimaplasma bacterium]
MQAFTEDVLHIIKSIPSGMVMTYGQIAALADNPRGARQVSRILHGMSESHQLPWHRVINSQGKISLTGEMGNRQRGLLRQEGIQFKDNTISLHKYQFHLT